MDTGALLREREKLRTEKRYEEADAIREKLEDAGYLVVDTQRGPFVYWKRGFLG